MAKARMLNKYPDVDCALQLLQAGAVWDGYLISKTARDHFVKHGYAVKHSG